MRRVEQLVQAFTEKYLRDWPSATDDIRVILAAQQEADAEMAAAAIRRGEARNERG